MTPPPPDARWCLKVAGLLADVADRVGRLADRIAEDWPDDHGREWAERTALLHRELGRSAPDAADLGSEILLRSVAAAARRGPRLGDTTGTRAQDGYGMRIAELPPP